VDATNLLQILRIQLAVMQSQRRRIAALFDLEVEAPPSVDDFRQALKRACSERLTTTASRSADRTLLLQVLSSIDSTAPWPTSGIPSMMSEISNQAPGNNATLEMINGEDFGGAFMMLARSISESPNGLTKANLGTLKLYGEKLLGSITRVEEKFGVTISPMLKSADAILLPTLICGSWSCDIRSDAFIDTSFLWNWMRPQLVGLLDVPDALLWLQNPEEVLRACLAQTWDVQRQYEFGHTFFHAVLLGAKLESRRHLFAQGATTRLSLGGRTLSHYAAAVGDEHTCQALNFSDFDVHDENDRLPIFYAVHNNHLGLAKLFATRR
jgi:hypothetical protein